MTDMYTEQQGSKKKYLIPLVVLLLCAVSLTGAGYAYNSTITGGDNSPVDADDFTLDTITVEFDENTLVVTQDYNATGDEKFGANQYVSHVNAGTGDVTLTVGVKLAEEMSSATLTAELVGFKVGSTYYTLAEGVALTIGSSSVNIKEIITGASGTATASDDGNTDIDVTLAITAKDINEKASLVVTELNKVSLVFKVTGASA